MGWNRRRGMKVSGQSDRGDLGSYDSEVKGLLKIGTPVLLLALMHWSAWKVNSENFGCRNLNRTT